jgi:hypothetical protein
METEICKIIKKNGALDALRNEDVLQINITIVEVPTAIEEMVRCKNHLQINGKPIEDSNLTMNSIQYNAFDKLFTEATTLRGTSTQRYVTGLRVHLGIKGSKVVLLFQPTCLSKSPNPNEPNRYYAFDGLYYTYDNSQEKFVPATVEELAYITNYQSTIRIKHFGKEIYEILDQSVDTRSIVIPFQIIFSLIYDNEQNSDVFLFNAIVNGGDKINHTMLMGTGNDDDGIHPITGEYTGKYANRSHLCPPCNYVETLVIARPGPTTCP